MFMCAGRTRARPLVPLRLPNLVVGMLSLTRGGRAFQHHPCSSTQQLLRGLRTAQQATAVQPLPRPLPTSLVATRASFSILSMSWEGESGWRDSRNDGDRSTGSYGSDRRSDRDRGFSTPNTDDRRNFGGGAKPRKATSDRTRRIERNNGETDPREGWGQRSSRGGGGRGGRERAGRGVNGLNNVGGFSGRPAYEQGDSRDRRRGSDDRSSFRGGGRSAAGRGGRSGRGRERREERSGRNFRDFGDGRRRQSNGDDLGGERPGRDFGGSGRGRGARGDGERSSFGARGAGGGGEDPYVEKRPHDTRGGPGRTHRGLDDVLEQYKQGQLGGNGDVQESAEDDDEEGGEVYEERPASDWMKGELSEYQIEASPGGGKLEEDGDVDMVYGIAPVLNAMQNTRREVLGLYCQDGLTPANKKDRSAANRIYDLAREGDVIMTTSDKGYLNTLCGNRPHQGFVLKARKLEFEPILFLPPVNDPTVSTATTTPTESDSAQENNEANSEKEVEEETSALDRDAIRADITAARGQVWLALDEVTDPQNFGALLRSAHFFGASGVVTCAKNSASLTPTVTKASAGAAEVMRVHSTANMMRFLKRSRENGWRVVGTAVSERSLTLHELPAGRAAPPTIVVLGNEGYGVRANVLKECDVLVEVAGAGEGAMAAGAKQSTVDSLNVSVTGGVMLFHLLAGPQLGVAAEPAAAEGEEVAVVLDPEASVTGEVETAELHVEPAAAG